jgi:hypothetical protein
MDMAAQEAILVYAFYAYNEIGVPYLSIAHRTGRGVAMMANQNARLTFLRLIEEHQGQWGWYQFERAFPPGWFIDEPPGKTAKQILDALELDGLVRRDTGEPQQRYWLTDKGMVWLREAAIGSTIA